jgi:transposase-like protein
MIFLGVYLGGDFLWRRKDKLSTLIKREVVRLKLEEGWSYRQLREHFGIKSDAQIAQWIKKVQRGESWKINEECGIANIFPKGSERLYLVHPKTIKQVYQAIEEYIHFFITVVSKRN